MRRLVCVLSVFVLLAGGACSRKSNGLYPVWGEVTHNGAPAAGAAVFFRRKGADSMQEQTVMGIVQEDGSFELVCGSQGPGAPPGEYDVLIEWKQVEDQSRGRPRRGPDKLHGRYADAKNPRLHATVNEEPNELAPFELTDE